MIALTAAIFSAPGHESLHAFIICYHGKRKRRGKVIGTTQNFSARIAVKGFLCATALTLVLIATLLFASSARATVATVQLEGGETTLEVSAPSGGTTAPSEGTGGEAGTPAEGSVTGGEGTPPAEATPPPAESGSPPAESPTTTEPSPPAENTTVETTPEAPSVGEVLQTTQETVSQAGEVLAPVIKEVAVPEVVVTSTPSEERVKPTESTKEAVQAETIAVPTAAVSPPSPPSAPQAVIATTIPAVPGVEPQGRPTRSSASGVTVMPVSAAQRAGEISCALSGLTGRMSEDCSAGLLSDSSLIAVDPVAPASYASPARKAAHVGGGYSEPAGGGRSGMPPPSPSPGGAFGGSAAAGSGLALSGFFTLAGLLLFAAPCAMRRLRLSCRPWRTAFFVLIPERPG